MLHSYIKEKYRQQKSHCGSYLKNTESGIVKTICNNKQFTGGKL